MRAAVTQTTLFRNMCDHPGFTASINSGNGVTICEMLYTGPGPDFALFCVIYSAALDVIHPISQMSKLRLCSPSISQGTRIKKSTALLPLHLCSTQYHMALENLETAESASSRVSS